MEYSTILLAAYFVFFAALHSLLASLWFKRQARKILGAWADRWYRLAYVIVALATAAPLIYGLTYFPGPKLYLMPSPWCWLMMTIQALAGLLFLKTFLETNPLTFLGLKAQPKVQGKLIVRGIYCRVRNPLFLFGLIFLWSIPLMTLNLLILYLLTTVYFCLGALHEERMLLDVFGDSYRDYRDEVPRMIPRLDCQYSPPKI